MVKLTPGVVIKTAIISAFTFITALIWRDVITGILNSIVPVGGNKLLYQFITAIIATILIFILLYIYLRTESQTDIFLKKVKKKIKK